MKRTFTKKQTRVKKFILHSPLLILHLLIFLLTAFDVPAQNIDPDYTQGVFFVNEDWYGHQNSSVNFLSNDGEWTYRVFQKANPGKELGCTSQFGTIYEGKFYIVSKQEKDPGASVTGSRLVVCDAKTMKCLKEFQTIATNEQGKSIADGRSFVGVNEKKGYIGTSNGVWIYDIEKMEIGGQINGTGNPNSSGYGQLYYAQIGNMIRTGDYVFAVHQQDGIKVIDAETDQLVTTIVPPKYIENSQTKSCGFGSIVQSKDGNLWVSMAANTNGTGSTLPYMLKLNPVTFQIDSIHIPVENGIEEISNSWYAWTADGFCASTQQNKIYWSGNNGNSWFKGRRIFCYDIDSDMFSKVFDFEIIPGQWVLYGAGFRIHPETDELYCSLFHDFLDPAYEVMRINNKGELLQEYSMITNYWFPAMPVFPVQSGVTAIDNIAQSKINVFPNPATDQLRIESEEWRIKKIIITNMNGSIFYQAEPNVFHYQLSILNYPKGIYIVKVTTEKENQTCKIVKN